MCKLRLIPLRARLAGVVVGLVCSLSSLASVIIVFASASGEPEPVQVGIKAAPAASEVAGKLPVKPVLRG